MNGVVSSVHTGSLGVAGDAELVLTCSTLSSDASLKVALGVFQHVAKELSEFRSVLCLLESVALESLGNLWIALTVGLAAHCEIHTHLTALTVEVSLEVLYHFLVGALLAGSAQFVYCSESIFFTLYQLFELRCWSLAYRALLWSSVTLINVTANGANKFLLHNVFVFICYLFSFLKAYPLIIAIIVQCFSSLAKVGIISICCTLFLD